MNDQIELQPNNVIAALVRQRNELADKVAYLEAALEQLRKQLEEEKKE